MTSVPPRPGPAPAQEHHVADADRARGRAPGSGAGSRARATARAGPGAAATPARRASHSPASVEPLSRLAVRRRGTGTRRGGDQESSTGDMVPLEGLQALRWSVVEHDGPARGTRNEAPLR